MIGNMVGVMCFDLACSVDHTGLFNNPVAVRTDDYFTYLNLDSDTITGSATGVDAVDRGGNQAYGNSLSPQCVGVHC